MKNYLKQFKALEKQRQGKAEIETAANFARDGEQAPALRFYIPYSEFVALDYAEPETFEKCESASWNKPAAFSAFDTLFFALPPLKAIEGEGIPFYFMEKDEEVGITQERALPVLYYIRMGGLGETVTSFTQWREILGGFLARQSPAKVSAKEISRQITEDNFNAFAFLLNLFEAGEKPKDGEAFEEFIDRAAARLAVLVKDLGEILSEAIAKKPEYDPENFAKVYKEIEEGGKLTTTRAARLIDDLEEISGGLERKNPTAIETKQAFALICGQKDENEEEARELARARASLPVNFVANNVATALNRLHFNFEETENEEEIERGLEWFKRFSMSKKGLQRAKARLRRIEKQLKEMGEIFPSEAEYAEYIKLKEKREETLKQIEELNPEELRAKSANILIEGFNVYRGVGSVETYINDTGEVEAELAAGGGYVTRVALPPAYALRESEGFTYGVKGIVRTIEEIGLAKARKTNSATVYFTNDEITEIMLGSNGKATASEQVIKNAKQDFKYFAEVLRKRDIKSAKLDTVSKNGIRKQSADIYGVEVITIGSDYKGVWLTFNADLFKWAVLGSSYFTAMAEGAKIESPAVRNAYLALRRQENNPGNPLTGAYSLEALADMSPELPAPKRYTGTHFNRDILAAYKKTYSSIPAELMEACEFPESRNGQAHLLTKEGAKKRAKRLESAEEKKPAKRGRKKKNG